MIQSFAAFEKKNLKVKRALLSVFDKTGIAELGQFLHEQGVELISTGGTAKTLIKAGLPVTSVDSLTGFPEMMDGRVKTLHPAIHGPLLSRPVVKSDMASLHALGYAPIELLVVNLYPFSETVAESPGFETCMENIDIGGPAMLRAAAKNVDHVCVLTSPEQYKKFQQEVTEHNGTVRYKYRLRMAQQAFQHTSIYDTAVAMYLSKEIKSGFPDVLNLQLRKFSPLRYGENPHQAAAVYGDQGEIIEVLHGKQLSYNNLLDVDAALNLFADFRYDDPTCAIIKHTLPCGVATRADLTQAWHAAFATDTISPFGGIVLVNESLDLPTAKAIDSIFTEIVVAPDFDNDALELLTQKANRRLVKIKKADLLTTSYSYRSIFGGLLCQQPDSVEIETKNFKVVTHLKPTEKQLSDMLFAWKVVKRVNSNAIVFGRDQQTLGIGSGQPSRLDSSEFAVLKAAKFDHDLKGAAVASDAFFPFRDGIDAIAKAGAGCVIQPGGSIRDQEVIDAANEHGLCMVFTGRRHFKH
ncbi:MAG: bifunctional phosphoribosylaminoimidazolecarboxamide formyltransferase/IMP cyclohydrolase [Balneolales bacterium]|nr:bifunctional phosphoribosylaminoimidazolecarboxamide formyltransferase/IMP cyclohydrolase [Balneolales bacterium]